MSDPNLENAVTFLFSSLFFTIEELALKCRACQNILQREVQDSEWAVANEIAVIRKDDVAARNEYLRGLAVQAVRDRNFDELIGLAGEIAGKTRSGESRKDTGA